MKVIVKNPNGVREGDTLRKAGETFEPQKGPKLEMWLRFKDVEEVKEKPAKGGDSESKK